MKMIGVPAADDDEPEFGSSPSGISAADWISTSPSPNTKDFCRGRSKPQWGRPDFRNLARA